MHVASCLSLNSNAHYAGKVEYGGETYAGEHQPIIRPEVWAKTQALLQQRARFGEAAPRTEFSGILKGILKCGSCGASTCHTYTRKGNKQGARACATRSIPAQEIEDFIVGRIAAIGLAPAIVAGVEREARAQRMTRLAALETERALIQKGLRQQARQVAGLLGDSNSVRRLADLETQLRAGEARLGIIAAEAAGLEGAKVTRADVVAALSRFPAVFNALPPGERAQVLDLLVERVAYNGEKGRVAISFHPTGIKTLAEEAAP